MLAHLNGDDGIFLFPITDKVTYIVRENAVQKKLMPFDMFVVIGDHPDHLHYDFANYICSVHNYATACRLIEIAIEQAEKLQFNVPSKG